MPYSSRIRKIKKNLRQILFLPVALILGSFIILIVSFFLLMTNLEWSVHSTEVIAEARRGFKKINNAQNALRSYKISHQDIRLEDYHSAMEGIDSIYKRLLEMVRDNSEQRRNAESVVKKKDRLVDFLDKELAAGPSFGDAVKELLEWDQHTDGLLEATQKFINTEESLQKERFHRVDYYRNLTLYLGVGVTLTLMVMISLHVYRKIMILSHEYEELVTALEKQNDALQRVQEELQQQRKWFDVTLRSIGDAVMATDSKGQVTFLNPEAVRLTGWEEKDALGRRVYDLISVKHEDTRENIPNLVDEVLQDKQSLTIVQDAVLAGNKMIEIPIQISASPILDTKKDIQGVVLVFHDASAAREARKSLINYSKKLELEVEKRTEHLKRALVEMESFSYTVSHDLRSPLRAMQGYAEALLEDQGQRLDQTANLYLNRIQSAAERLDKLIQDLLSYSRVGREDTPMVAVNVQGLVQDMIAQYPNLQSPQAEITISGTLPKVVGRESALTQIFSNLLGNAVKFVEPGVKPKITIRAEIRGSRARFWIEDNGIGIKAEDYERVFRIFEQLNKPKLYTGTGVGLAIVKKAVENLNGSLGLESRLKKGTSFWFELDRVKDTAL